MLVLTRRVDESIRIGDNIRITVVKIKERSKSASGWMRLVMCLCCVKSCLLSAQRLSTSQNRQIHRSCQSSGLVAYHGGFSHTAIV